jgi:hypothetical protein
VITENSAAKVIVEDPFRIVHKGTAHTAGDVITVDNSTATEWERAGWVRRAPRTYFESEKLKISSYRHGVVSVGTTATLVTSVGEIPENSGVLVQPSADTFFGGSTVTATGATAGIKVTANSIQLMPTTGAGTQDLYAVVATSTSNVTFLHP